MAYVVSTTDTTYQDTGASITASIGANLANDLILICVTNRLGAGTSISTPAGYTAIGTQTYSNSIRHQWFYKLSAGSESGPTFTGQNDAWTVTTLIVRDVDTVTPISTVSGTDFIRKDFNSVNSSTSGAVTSGVNQALLVYSWAMQSTINQMRCSPSELMSVSLMSGAHLGQIVGVQQQESAGAAPTVTMYLQFGPQSGQGWVLVIRNKTGGARQPTLRQTSNEISWYGDYANFNKSVTWQTGNNFAATINGISVSSAAVNTNTGVTNTLTPWGNYTEFRITDITASLWCGYTHTIASTDFTGKVIYFQWEFGQSNTNSHLGSEGIIACFSDGTNWAAYQIQTKTKAYVIGTAMPAFIVPGYSTAYATSGSINWAAVTRVGYFYHRAGSDASQVELRVKNLILLGTTAVTGGGSSHPSSFTDVIKPLASCWGYYKLAELQGSGQCLTKSPIQIGDGGSNLTYFDCSAQSAELPPAFSLGDASTQATWNATAGAITVNVKAGASDTINLTAGIVSTAINNNLTIDAASSTSATYSTSGTSFVGWTPTWKTGVTCNSATFKNCGIIDFKGASISNVSVSNGTDTAACSVSNGFSATNCTFTASTTDVYGLRIAAAGTFSLTGTTFSGFTKDIDVTAAVGTVTINLAQGQATPTYQTAGATVTIVPYTDTISFTGLVAGSQVIIYNSGATTIIDSTNSSGTSFTSVAVTTPLSVAYTVMKAGYDPIHVPSFSVTGTVSIPISQTVDRAYIAGNPGGLTFGVDTIVNVSARAVTSVQLTKACTTQNWYSYLIDCWIASSTNTTLKNTPFPVQKFGPNSFTLSNGVEFSDGATSIGKLSRDGLRYASDAAGVTTTAEWAAILTLNTDASLHVKYRQSSGGAITTLSGTGPMDQLIQVYGDAGHGSINYSNYLDLKAPLPGWTNPKADVYATYGTLEDEFYVAALAPVAQWPCTNSSVANTAFDNTAKTSTISADMSMQSFYQGAQYWSCQDAQWNADTPLTSLDGATFTQPSNWTVIGTAHLSSGTLAGGTAIIAAGTQNISFNGTNLTLGAEGTYTFNMVGSLTATVTPTADNAHYVFGSGTFNGTLTVHNTTAHPIVVEVPTGTTTSSTGNTGGAITFSTPLLYQSVTVSGATAGSRIQIYDTTHSTELYNGTPTFPFTWTDGSPVASNRAIRLRVAYCSGVTAKNFIDQNIGTCGTLSGTKDISYLVSQTDDTSYNTSAIDGSAVANISITVGPSLCKFTAGGPATFAAQQIYAYQVYWQATATGIAQETAFISSPDSANFLVTSFQFENEIPNTIVTINNGYVVDSVTKTPDPLVSTTVGKGTVNILGPHAVLITSSSGSLSTAEHNQLMAIPTTTIVTPANFDKLKISSGGEIVESHGLKA